MHSLPFLPAGRPTSHASLSALHTCLALLPVGTIVNASMSFYGVACVVHTWHGWMDSTARVSVQEKFATMEMPGLIADAMIDCPHMARAATSDFGQTVPERIFFALQSPNSSSGPASPGPRLALAS